MIRSLALTVSFFLAGAAPALTQTHPQSHPQGRPHDQSSHTPLDPALHAAMHARLLGSWTGTLSSPAGVSKRLDLTVANDKRGTMTLKLKTDLPFRSGTASNIAMDGDGLHWMQNLSGASCKVTAVLSAGTAHSSDVMKGMMACEHEELTFALHKK